MHLAHNGVPNGRRARETGDVDHGLVVSVAHPHPHRELGGEAHRPVVLEAVGRAGFGGDLAVGQGEVGVGAKGGRTRHVIAHDVGKDIGDIGVDNALGFGLVILLEYIAGAVAYLQHRHGIESAETGAQLLGQARLANHDAAVAQHRVGVGVVDERDFATAQHQAKAVESQAAVEPVDAQLVGHAQRIAHANLPEYAHGGDVI